MSQPGPTVIRLLNRARWMGGQSIGWLFRRALSMASLLRSGAIQPSESAWPSDLPLVTVLVRGHGGSSAMEATLAEVSAATMKDLEVLTLNGQSGRAAARPRGKHLMILDEGLSVSPTYLERCLLVLESTPACGFVVALPVDAAAGPDDAWAGFAPVFRTNAWVDAAGMDLEMPVTEACKVAMAAGWEGRRLVEPGLRAPATAWDRISPQSYPPARSAWRRLLCALARGVPVALRTDLRMAFLDFRYARRVSAGSAVLGEYGRGITVSRLSRPTVFWLLPWLQPGGAEAVLYNLASALGRRYHFVLCLTVNDANTWRGKFEELGAEVFDLPKLLPQHKWPTFLERVISLRKPDVVVNSHSEFGYTCAGRLKGCFRSVRFYDLLHNDSELGYISHAVRHSEDYDGHIVVSDRIRVTLERRQGKKRVPVHVIYNGIDTARRFSPELHEPIDIGPGNGPVIGFLGRLSSEKDPLLFVETAKELVAQGRMMRFVMVGDGPLRSRLESRVSMLGLDRCFFMLGHREDVPAVLKTLDLCLVTSEVEGFPLSVIESLAMGVPVVSTDVGNLRDVLVVPLGRVVSGRSSKVLAQAALEELDRGMDPARRSRIRDAVRDSYGFERMAELYDQLFSKAAVKPP